MFLPVIKTMLTYLKYPFARSDQTSQNIEYS